MLANGERDNKANSEGHYRKNGLCLACWLAGFFWLSAVCSSQVSKHLALKYRWDYGTEYAWAFALIANSLNVASCQLARLPARLKLAACSCNCICINYAAKVVLQVVIRPDRHRQKTRRWKTEDRRPKTATTQMMLAHWGSVSCRGPRYGNALCCCCCCSCCCWRLTAFLRKGELH